MLRSILLCVLMLSSTAGYSIFQYGTYEGTMTIKYVDLPTGAKRTEKLPATLFLQSEGMHTLTLPEIGTMTISGFSAGPSNAVYTFTDSGIVQIKASLHLKGNSIKGISIVQNGTEVGEAKVSLKLDE